MSPERLAEVPTEFHSRVPLWIALSLFWLDTELGPDDYDFIARVVRESPFTQAEVHDIHLHEVAPVVASNLSLYGAWIWGAFDDAWLVSRCVERAGMPRRARWTLAGWATRRAMARYVDPGWTEEIVPRLKTSGPEVTGANPTPPR